MEIDVGLDAVGLTYEVETEMTVHAARLGYNRIWTGSIGDPFQTCALRWAETRAVVPGGIATAIGVIPVGPRTPADLALSAAALSRTSGGRFILGIGAGSTYEPAYRTTWGIEERSPLAITRAYLMTLRGFLSGESVTYHGQGLNYDNARLPAQAAATPLYLGVVGPEMARLGGELADGVYLSWCTPDNVDWVRTRITEGAERAGRDPSEVKLAASVRICVDDDGDAARRALAGALLPYVLGWGGTPPRPFRTNFERMGFGRELREIDRMRERDLPRPQIIEAFPERMLLALGYFGPAGGAAHAVQRHVGAADIAVVRIVPAGPGVESSLAIVDASRPPGRQQTD
jgi:alkanesulfonate monooxygenase SsuD/methylene tetrahydromethanopterin reductase-like flavin-dependent oxidoreductase (luciferase family)